MAERIELPPILQGDENAQLQQLWSYLYQMSEALNNNLQAIGGNELTDSDRQVMNKILGEAGEKAVASGEMETLKSLIIKTADFVQTSLQEYRLHLLGESVTSGQFGRYVRRTGLDVAVTPEGITQNYSFEEVVQGLKEFSINAKNYIKTGLLRTVGSEPVYGVAIGKDVVTFSEDGTETYNDRNKVAELTAEELSFWQNSVKIAGYTGSRISFYYAGNEVFYIQQGKLYAVGDIEITSGKKLILASGGGLDVNSGGNMNVKSGGKMTLESGAGMDVSSGGNVNVNSGGNMNVKSGGKMTVESGGGLDVNSGGNVNVKNGGKLTLESGGDVDIKTGGKFTVQSGQFGIDAQGNATFGGNLNAAGGTFAGNLQAAGGTFAGNLSAAGGTFSGNLSAAGGTFAGNLQAAGGTFSGNLSAAGGTFSGDLQAAGGTFAGNLQAAGGTFSGTLQAGAWTVNNSGMTYDDPDYDGGFEIAEYSNRDPETSGLFYRRYVVQGVIGRELILKVETYDGNDKYENKFRIGTELQTDNTKYKFFIPDTSDGFINLIGSEAFPFDFGFIKNLKLVDYIKTDPNGTLKRIGDPGGEFDYVYTKSIVNLDFIIADTNGQYKQLGEPSNSFNVIYTKKASGIDQIEADSNGQNKKIGDAANPFENIYAKLFHGGVACEHSDITDYNDLTEDGLYWVNVTDVHGNTPVGMVTGTAVVEVTNISTTVRQQIIYWTKKIFLRKYSSGTWGDWCVFYGSPMDPTTKKFNGLTAEGKYSVNMSEMIGGPTGVTSGAAIIQVDVISQNMIYQRIYVGDCIYMRFRYLGTWSSWYKFQGTAV